MAGFRVGSSLSFYIKELNAFHTKGIRKLVDDYLIKNRRYFLSRIKIRLWVHGESGDGTILKPYSEVYAKYKKSVGHKSRPTTLHLTGAWYHSMFVRIESELHNHRMQVLTRADQAEKTRYLKKKYGARILTLNQEEQIDIANDLQETVQKRIDNLFGGGVHIKMM